MSPASRDIVTKLRRAGYEAYIVGGAIRDLLLGQIPTDFDVVTDATPEQMKTLFRSATIIGRRFLIVHVRLYSDLVEVSTFRREPTNKNQALSKSELYKRAENAYGTIEDDFQRRDFTLNAFYFDPEKEAILDFVDGMHDIKLRRLRCINDPQQRFAEDPCRILRAVRFSSMLDLKLDPQSLKAIHQTKNLLNFVSPSRICDQLMKLFLRGNASKAFAQLSSMRILPILFGSRDVANDLSTIAMVNSDERVSATVVHGNVFVHHGSVAVVSIPPLANSPRGTEQSTSDASLAREEDPCTSIEINTLTALRPRVHYRNLGTAVHP